MTLPDTAVVMVEIFMVVRVEVGGEDVGVPAGVMTTDIHVRILTGVVISSAGS